MTTPIDASNAALDAYNLANARVNDAAQKLFAFQQLPPEQQYGTTRTQLETDLRSAQTAAADSARQYATMLQQQAEAGARSTDPGAQARADRDRNQADYYRARADGYAAKDAAAQQAAQTRADAALQRANTAAGRIDAQNDKDTAGADASRAAADASHAQADHTRAETANMETPAAASARRINEEQAKIRADAQARIDELLAPYQAGVKLTDEEQLKLQDQLAEVRAQADREWRAQQSQLDFERTQPNVERQLKVSEQNAATQRQQVEQIGQNQKDQLDRQNRQDQAGALMEQAKAGQGLVQGLVTGGVTPSLATLKFAYNPLRQALSVLSAGVKSGTVDPNSIPQPSAPAPPGMEDDATAPEPTGYSAAA